MRVARLDGGRHPSSGRDDLTFDGRAIHNIRLMAAVVFELPLPGPRTETDPGWLR